MTLHRLPLSLASKQLRSRLNHPEPAQALQHLATLDLFPVDSDSESRFYLNIDSAPSPNVSLSVNMDSEDGELFIKVSPCGGGPRSSQYRC